MTSTPCLYNVQEAQEFVLTMELGQLAGRTSNEGAAAVKAGSA